MNDKTFEELWNSQKAHDVREQVKNCSKECWMIGSASPAMKKKVWVPAKWVVKNKLRMMKDKRGETCLEPVGK